ncbi:small cell adhesion glycoprotein isoform X2 [Ahaetulla prasina]|uniref:small cell adhesion glycoprotein isoform X2 n=1 Tax=Ahaetulla prasina TaxID=499056 RepID=UPI00264745D4|nr:small cell adhesion glycoprotein isoform X2 [Ahaetulla prasina]
MGLDTRRHYKELRNKHSDDSAVYYQRSKTGKVRWAGERLSLLKARKQLQEESRDQISMLVKPGKKFNKFVKPILFSHQLGLLQSGPDQKVWLLVCICPANLGLGWGLTGSLCSSEFLGTRGNKTRSQNN